MPAPTEDITAPAEIISDRDRRCTGVAAEIARGLSLPGPDPQHVAAAGFLHDAIATRRPRRRGVNCSRNCPTRRRPVS